MVNSRAGKLHRWSVTTASQTVNNSTTEVATTMTLPVSPNQFYVFTLRYFIDSGTTPDIKINLTVPSGTSGQKSISGLSASPTVTTSDLGSSLVLSTTGAGNVLTGTIHGQFLVSSTAGFITVTFAQNVADVSDTKMLDGSSLKIWRN